MLLAVFAEHITKSFDFTSFSTSFDIPEKKKDTLEPKNFLVEFVQNSEMTICCLYFLHFFLP